MQHLFIKINKTLHKKKYRIADKIDKQRRGETYLMSGPVASGKTTFSKQFGSSFDCFLAIGRPVSLDDYL